MKKIPVQQLTPRQLVLPLALCQFIASYACTNMNVAISDISKDLNTTVIGVQTAITLFTLTMASLMIPDSKLTGIWGRERRFTAGPAVKSWWTGDRADRVDLGDRAGRLSPARRSAW